MTPYYQDAWVTLFHADNQDVLPGLEAGDHILTDPPYSSRTRQGARTHGVQGTHLTFEATAQEVEEVLGQGARVGIRWAVFSVDYALALRWEARPPEGFRQLRLGVWDKLGTGAPQFTGDRPAMGYEMVSHLHRADVRPKWHGGGHDAVYRHPVVRTRGCHPTEKPLPLLLSWVDRFTRPHELIWDPWAGSGTTGAAAKLLGRRAVLIEREERWCERAALRLSQEVLFNSPAPVAGEASTQLKFHEPGGCASSK